MSARAVLLTLRSLDASIERAERAAPVGAEPCAGRRFADSGIELDVAVLLDGA